MGIKNNISIKLLSLGIALVIWTVIMNILNPIVSGFISMPIEIHNEEYVFNLNKTYTVLDTRVIKINYKVNSERQNSIRQNDFKVYIDLKELDSTEMLPVHCEPLNGIDSYISNLQVEPNTLHVVMDDVSRSEFKVQYDFVGNIDDTHSIGNVILSPNIVYVSGSNVAIEIVDRVEIDIELNDKEEMYSGIAKVKLIDKQGKEMPTDGFALSAEQINYSVVMYSKSNVNLNTIVEGEVKNGYWYAGTEVIPNNIMINGPKSVIQNIYTLDLPVINIDGKSETIEHTYKVEEFLPIGITSNVAEVKVIVTINDRVLNRPTGSRENLGPHINDETVEVNVEEESESE